ncbi:hypothetical protein COCOBI_02-0200 [Coccomyxa sp. Obi]|nr:hypothetical protein COCOBI_02-0200 [Coccomyxa sp. Obi]
MSTQQALTGLLQGMSQLNGNGCVKSVVEPESFSMSIYCPKNMVGRVIGKGGETIKALQQYTGAMIQIDQSQDPTRVTIVGKRQSLYTASSMVKDIVEGNFKGFAMLRQMTLTQTDKGLPGWDSTLKPQPVYIQGYGFVPPSQYVDAEDGKPTLAGSLADSSFVHSQLSQADPLSPMFQHGVSAAQFNALTANGNMLGNAQILDNGSVAFPPGMAIKTVNGFSPLAPDADVKNPASRRLFNGIAMTADGCAPAQQRAQSPANVAAAASLAQPSAVYRSAPTSPQSNTLGESQAMGAAMFDFRSAPTSPSSAAFSFGPNVQLQGYSQQSTGIGALTNSISSLDLGALDGGSGQANGNIFNQFGQDDYLSTDTGANGMTADTSAAIQAINARLGLDSSLGLFGMGPSPRAYQSLDGGPRSISMGALGQNRQTFFGGANGTPSFGAVSTGIASQATAAQQQQAMNQAMTQAMLSQLVGTKQSAGANGRASPKGVSAAPAVSMEAAAAHAPQEVSKGSPASSYSSTSSLFASGGATPRLPHPWMQAKDPEGRHFFLNPSTGESQWDFPTA